ncbi:hypothetical protein AKJ64_00895 [candidate division MSBL1 archaeon SCGC-AAA259E17]|uniref:Uncharacterized protein n=1 Tax=candidate division MSBL1 archaeon SCGC-AAA259E17 TaxID=1698263 RepID=A0A133UGW0_9EURY|nr:hypothetical protein AKJ64_00895 [candidate division MSBL1 archaeon SCGC-AAA259E17]
MSFYKGSGKYAWKNLIFNFGKMYVCGGTILTALSLLWVLLTTGGVSMAEFIKQVIMVMVPNPNFFLLNLVINPVVGVIVSTISWSESMKRRGRY